MTSYYDPNEGRGPAQGPVCCGEGRPWQQSVYHDGMPGSLYVLKGAVGSRNSSDYLSKPYNWNLNNKTCEQIREEFAAKDKCAMSRTLQVILAYMAASRENFLLNGAGSWVGASDADIHGQLVSSVCPTSPLTLAGVTALVTQGLRTGIFRIRPSMVEGVRMVCLDPNFGFRPHLKHLYDEMGGTALYPFALGIV